MTEMLALIWGDAIDVTETEEVRGMPHWYFFNHADSPNAEGLLKNVLYSTVAADGTKTRTTSKGIVFFATCDIKAGEQIFYKYTMEFNALDDNILDENPATTGVLDHRF